MISRINIFTINSNTQMFSKLCFYFTNVCNEKGYIVFAIILMLTAVVLSFRFTNSLSLSLRRPLSPSRTQCRSIKLAPFRASITFNDSTFNKPAYRHRRDATHSVSFASRSKTDRLQPGSTCPSFVNSANPRTC